MTDAGMDIVATLVNGALVHITEPHRIASARNDASLMRRVA
jgi:hypothetical protein